ncbi:MAG TPA: EAL domain-containing protein [Gammaproteobacteria bacterium]
MSAVMTSKKLVVTPEAQPSAERILQSERVGVLRHLGRWIDIGAMGLALLAALAFWSSTPHAVVVAWLTGALALSLGRLVLSWAFPLLVLSESARRTWQDVFMVLSLGLGILWGLGGWIFFEPGSTVHQIALVALLVARAAMPTMVLATHRHIYLTYLGALFGPLLLRLVAMLNVTGALIAFACFAVAAVMWLLVDEGGREMLANIGFRLAYREARLRLADEVTTRTRYQSHLVDHEDRTRRRESKLLEVALDPRITGGNLRAACELISEQSQRATGAARVSVWFMNRKGSLLRNAHTYLDGTHVSRATQDITREDSGELFEQLAHSRGISVPDVRRNASLASAWKRYFASTGARAVLFVPFRNGSGVHGIILHEWMAGKTDGMPGDMAFASSLADSMTLALHSAERSASEIEMRRLATVDTLTGLPNRTAFMDRLNQALAHAGRHHERLALLFVDVDRFKTINDSLGHPVGDQVLKEIGRRLVNCVRAEDVVARLGGDEFMVLMAGCEDPKAVTFTAQRILDTVSGTLNAAGVQVHTGCSIGISTYPEDGADAATLMKNADLAMYRVKERGRNGFQFFTRDMQALATLRLARENALRWALERHEFKLHYQPQFDVRRGGIYGVEALLRWEHPELGTVPPAEFIPLAEETGLIVPIGRWALREACRQMKAWHDASGDRKLQVSVNLSVRQFAQGSLVGMVKEALDATGLPPACLKLEITESLLMRDIESNLQMLEELKLLGVRIALDDFGKEHSSMTYLKRLPIDAIKLDREFVKGAPENSYDRAIIHCLLALADSLRIQAVAEGVETPEQLAFLKSEGCRYVQGYLFSPPLPAREAGRLLCKELDLAV